MAAIQEETTAPEVIPEVITAREAIPAAITAREETHVGTTAATLACYNLSNLSRDNTPNRVALQCRRHLSLLALGRQHTTDHLLRTDLHLRPHLKMVTPTRRCCLYSGL
jgi:hypothetical protein